MHDILDVVMMATTAMSKKNATIQENYFKLGTKELCMSEVEICAISIRGLAFQENIEKVYIQNHLQNT